MGCGGKLAVEGWDGDTIVFPSSNQLAPDMGDAGIEAEHTSIHAFAKPYEPRLQARFALARRQAFNTFTKLSDGDGADVEFRLVVAKPGHDLGVGLDLSEFAQDVGIHKVAHSITGLGF